MRTLRYVTLCLGLSLILVGCSINTALFGSSKSKGSSSGGDNLQAVKGNFPLMTPFTGQFKNYLRAAPNKKFVFANAFNDIYVVSESGTYLKSFTPADTFSVNGLTVDSSGNIYIAGAAASPNENTHRFIRKYDINGTYLGEIVTYGDEDPGAGVYVPLPTQPRIGADGSIYVAFNAEIRKYNSAGVHQLTFGTGTQAANDGEINGAPVFTVNSDGSIYVADMWSDRVQLFNADGTFNSKFTWPRQIAMSMLEDLQKNADGNFLLTERMGSDARITFFDPTGALLFSLNGSEGGGAAWGTSDLTTATVSENRLYVGYRETVYVFNASTGAYVKDYLPGMKNPTSVLQAKNGHFYVGTDKGVEQFNAKGDWQRTFEPVAQITALAVTSSNVLVVANASTPTTLNKYDLDGNLLGTVVVPALAAPYSMSVDANDNIYIADLGGGGLQVLSTALGTASAFPGAIGVPSGVHCAKDGSILVLDFDGTKSIPKRFSAAGALLDTFDAAGADVDVGTALGITQIGNGRVYIAGTIKNKIYEYEADGTYVTNFGSAGTQLNQFNQPWSIFADAFGSLFVVDKSNDAVKKFKPDGTLLYE
ncbi:NHL repeat-containing protein [Bdellovibrio bacteriovorus]|uniref:NHL repeat-containing protein n=1 Tax=Bdellovibrio bacteriovorus TaxID=959 RepID=UPI000B1FB622|nr:NHL repeat-containing protein [Bdellovibrio bacteriovorus]